MTHDTRHTGHNTQPPFIIDAHIHMGTAGMYWAPGCEMEHALELMDRLQVQYAICSEMKFIMCGSQIGMQSSYELFERSEGRIFFQGVFDPRQAQASLSALEDAATKPGFVGVKIHPSLHGLSAEAPVFDDAWKFAQEHGCAILAHTWSASSYNPKQAASTPARFEPHVEKFPDVPFVMAHAGGKGGGRAEAIRLVNQYPNVYLDFAGDIYCYSFFDTMLKSIPTDRIIYGSDYPMLEPRTNLSRVLLRDIDDDVKMKILRTNAIEAYGLAVGG